jgi:hypothetical protein
MRSTAARTSGPQNPLGFFEDLSGGAMTFSRGVDVFSSHFTGDAPKLDSNGNILNPNTSFHRLIARQALA